MHSEQACPDMARWDRFLQGTLSEAEQCDPGCASRRLLFVPGTARSPCRRVRGPCGAKA